MQNYVRSTHKNANIMRNVMLVWFVKSAVPKKTRFFGIGVEEATSKQEVSASSPIPRVLRVDFI